MTQDSASTGECTGGQVVGSVAWHSSALAIAALIVGVPLGVGIGRLVWTSIVDQIGFVSAPVVSIPALAAVAVLGLAVANLAALGPGFAAARSTRDRASDRVRVS